MGILRTDKVSGLETPTSVTGSVSFDGVNSALVITENGDHFDFLNSDFTFECWIYPRGGASNNFGTIYSKGYDYQFYWKEDTERLETYLSSNGSSYNITSGANSRDGSVPANKWSHIAHTREGNTFRLFVNGSLLSTITSSLAIGANAVAARLADYGPAPGTYELDGDISNLRVLKGTALYTSDFTPPVHALEVIGDTVLLCCNNPDSVTAASYASIGTSHIITTAGNPTVSTNNPSLTRDFTGGTEFSGVTTFDTQGYFVPPSGTTEQRGAGRGIITGSGNPIHYISIHTQGNSQDFGDLSYTPAGYATCASSSTRGLVAGGYNAPTGNNTINAITISTTGNAINFGDIGHSTIYGMGGCGSNTRGLFGGGFKSNSSNNGAELQINYVTIASLGDSEDFGDLIQGVRYVASLSSPTRGIWAGGRTNDSAPAANKNVIQYVTIASTGTAVNFGDLTYSGSGGVYSARGFSSATRGVIGGGVISPAYVNNIDYITMASTGNSQEFGDIPGAISHTAPMSSKQRGIFAGGYAPLATNTMTFVTISTTGDAKDFGDLYSALSAPAGMSDSHGGLS